MREGFFARDDIQRAFASPKNKDMEALVDRILQQALPPAAATFRGCEACSLTSDVRRQHTRAERRALLQAEARALAHAAPARYRSSPRASPSVRRVPALRRPW